MSLPTQKCNLGGTQLFGLTDLGLSANLASSASTDSVAFSTGCPATVLVIAAASAGGASTLKLKVGSTSTIDMTSGTTDKIVPTLSQNFNYINTTTTSPFVKLRLTDGGSSTSYSIFTAFVFYGLTAGEDGMISVALNAVASTKINGTSDGSGVLTLSNQ